MAPRAEHVSLLFDSDDGPRAPRDLGSTIAGHLLGRTLEKGQTVCLPGWPTVIVEDIDPDKARVEAGTDVTVHLPPRSEEGPLSLVILVDASLTMGKGEPSRYERAARLVDALLLNGRSFVQSAGLIVQGGQTRNAVPLQPPEDLSGASILKIDPRGTFDLEEGIDQGLTLLEDAPEGPRAVLVVTDEGTDVEGSLALARPLLRAGVCLFMAMPDPPETAREGCRITGGCAREDIEEVFEALASLTGMRASWAPPEEVGFPLEDGHEAKEFEVVIEALEGSS